MYDIVIQTEQLFAHAGMTGQTLMLASRMAVALTVLGAACVIYLLCHRLIVPLMVRMAEKTVMEWDDILLNEKTLRAASHIVPGLFVWMFLPDVFASYRSVPEILSRATAFYVVLMSMRLCIAFIDSFKGFEGERRTAKQQYFHTFCGVLKIAIIFISVIVMLAVVIGRSPLTLLAGLGATSAILMLVFKDTITGLVAGVRLTSNDMLHKGDWITVPGTEVNGIVEGHDAHHGESAQLRQHHAHRLAADSCRRLVPELDVDERGRRTKGEAHGVFRLPQHTSGRRRHEAQALGEVWHEGGRDEGRRSEHDSLPTVC